MDHKQIIILRKDLNMRKGKLVAQGAHASLKAILDHSEVIGDDLLTFKMDERSKPWIQGLFKKICVYVTSEEELLTLYKKAVEENLLCSLIQDTGLTEFKGVPTYTAVAIGPDSEDKINKICQHLPLF